MTRERMEKLLEAADRYLVKNYKPQPIVLTRGERCRVWDVAGNRYLDMTGGIAACPKRRASSFGAATGCAGRGRSPGPHDAGAYGPGDSRPGIVRPAHGRVP